jgi:anti-sigma factor RsiW
MNCTRIEELIPLYVGCDVDRRLSREVQSHLKTCGGCAKLAAEYEASRNWLSGAPPEFDEALLADVKRGIMRELENAKPQAGLFALMSETVARTLLRPAVVAGLLLVVFGTLTFWLYAERQGSRPTQAVVTEDKGASERIARDSLGGATPSAKKQPQRTGVNHHTRAAGVSSNRRQRSIGVTEEQTITQIAEAKNEAQSPSAVAVDSDGMLRIEIQTVDPNIRIIWFAPKEIDNQQTNP